MQKNIKLSLVISGIPGYFKLRSQYDDLFRITAISLRKCLDYLENKLPGNVEICGLFNAYIEKVMAKRAANDPINVPFTSIFPKGMYADSGGLQMVTLGKGSVKKEDRLKIYKTQASYAHYAFSFDEIPAIIKDGERYYLPDLVEQKGIESGYNLKEQFDFFDEIKTDCKIIPIVQGWDIEDTNKFAKGLFSQLSKKQLKNVNIIATGFPVSSSYATAKRIYDIFKVNEIPYKARKHVHLLGVTGIKRLIPALILIKNGFTPQLECLSFDSASLSMTYVMGTTIPTVQNFLEGKAKKLKLGKKRTPEIETYWQEIYDFWKDDPHFPFKDLDDMLQHSYYNETFVEGKNKTLNLSTGYQQYKFYLQADKNGNYTKENKKIADFHFAKVLKQEQYYILYQVYNYIQIIEAFLEDKIKLEHIFDGKDLVLFKALENVKTDKEFEEWFEQVKKITEFSLPTLKGNFNQKHASFNLFEENQIIEKQNKRKKQPPRVSKIKNKSEDISSINDLF